MSGKNLIWITWQNQKQCLCILENLSIFYLKCNLFNYRKSVMFIKGPFQFPFNNSIQTFKYSQLTSESLIRQFVFGIIVRKVNKQLFNTYIYIGKNNLNTIIIRFYKAAHVLIALFSPTFFL